MLGPTHIIECSQESDGDSDHRQPRKRPWETAGAWYHMGTPPVGDPLFPYHPDISTPQPQRPCYPPSPGTVYRAPRWQGFPPPSATQKANYSSSSASARVCSLRRRGLAQWRGDEQGWHGRLHLEDKICASHVMCHDGGSSLMASPGCLLRGFYLTRSTHAVHGNPLLCDLAHHNCRPGAHKPSHPQTIKTKHQSSLVTAMQFAT